MARLVHGRMRLAAAVLLIVAAATASVASARFIVEKNSIKVISPHSLRGHHHEAAIANYGVPDYGGTLTGVVLYPADAKLANGCKPFGSSAAFKSRSGRPVVLLVDRGDCYFALKTWNAQQAGAAAVLVADSVEEPLLTMDTPEEETPDMAFLNNITAPSALVSKSFVRRRRRGGGGAAGLARVDAAPGRARGVRVLDQQQRRVRAAVRRAGGVRVRVPGPRAAAGEGRRRALHPALHHLVLPGPVRRHAAVRVAVHQQGPVLRAGPGGGPGGRVRGQGRGAREPPAAVRAPRGQRPERVLGVVGLRGRLPPPVLHEGEEVLEGVRRGGGGVAGPAGGDDRAVRGRPGRRRRQRRAQDGADRAGRAGEPGRRHHPAHARHQQRAVSRETGEHGCFEGDLRWFQGDHRAPCLPDKRHGDRRVPDQQRRLLARREDQRHGLQGHVQGEGVRVPGGGGRAVRGGRVQGVQGGRAGAVRRGQRRVLEGNQAGPDLLRLLGLRLAHRLRLPAGVPRRRPHLRRHRRVRREAVVLLPALPLQEHLGRAPLQVQGRRPRLHQGPGHLRGQERVGGRVGGGGAGALLPRRRRGRRVRLLQVQAQAVHGLGGRGDHVAVHASREPQQREPAAQGGGRGSIGVGKAAARSIN